MGALGLGPSGFTRGGKNEKKKFFLSKRKKKGKENKRNRERERKKERKKRKRSEKERTNERKRGQERKKVSQHDERGAMQFQAQAGAKGKKTFRARGAKLMTKRDKNNEHFRTYFIFGI